MKRRILMALVGLTLVLSLVLSVLPGCGGGAAPTATTPGATTPGKTTATPGKTTTAPTAPAKAGEVFNWRFQTGSTAGSAGYWAFAEFADDLKTASGGRINLDIFPSGAIIGSTEMFDGVMTGAVEVGGSLAMSNWSTKDLRFELMGQIAGGMTSLVHTCWQFGHTEDDRLSGGDKFRLVMEEKFPEIKIFAFNSAMRAPEAEYLAQKPLLKPADFVGLTFRGTGWSQLVATEMGAKGIFVPSSDVYSALQTGVMDAAELGTPYSNNLSGYMDICKYTGFPGIHKLSESSDLLVNRDSWNSLPADLQHIFYLCTLRHAISYGTQDWIQSAELMASGKLVGKAIITYETPEMQNTWRTISWRLADEEAAKDPAFKTQWDIMRKFQIMMDTYVDLQTPDYGPDYEGAKEKIPGLLFQ
ncbi:MAG: hypothetical protein V1894_06905 [Chloroflexota bacterium]